MTGQLIYLKAHAELVDGGTRDLPSVPYETVLHLLREKVGGRDMINMLWGNDWGTPPRLVRLTGIDRTRRPIDITVEYLNPTLPYDLD